MIKKPILGMRVFVDDPEHCNTSKLNENHSGFGRIIEIDNEDSFLVEMENYYERWWRCKYCVTQMSRD